MPLRRADMICQKLRSNQPKLELQKPAIGSNGGRNMRIELDRCLVRLGGDWCTVLEAGRAITRTADIMWIGAHLGRIRTSRYRPGASVRSNRYLLPKQQAAQQQADAAAKEFTSVLLSIHVRSVHPSIVSVLTQVRLGQSARGQFRIQDRTATQSR